MGRVPVPRAPLFRHVARLVRIALVASRTGERAPLVWERLEARRLDRRRLLGAFGAAAGQIVLAGTTAACGSEAASEEAPAASGVVVVGAGLAGLTAAYRLQQAGVAADIYDADTHVGGRTRTLRDVFATKGELGGEFVDTGHAHLRALLEELGLHLTDVRDDSLQSELVFVQGALQAPLDILTDFQPIASALQPLLDSLAGEMPDYRAASSTARQLDALSISDFFDQHGFDGPARAVIEAAYRGEYGRDAADQSLLNMLTLLGPTPSLLHLLGDSDQAYTITEGSDAVANGLADRLARPVTFGHRLVALRERADGSHQLAFDRAGESVEITAQAVVVTIPFTQLRKCDLALSLEPAQAQAIAGLRYGQNAKTLLGMAERPWRTLQKADGTSVCDEIFSESWDSSAGLPAVGAVLTAFAGGALGVAAAKGTDGDAAKRALTQLERIFPGVAAAYTQKTARAAWTTAPNVQGSYACYGPGDWTTLHGAEGLAAGSVFFAGEHTSVAYQGFMEGAVESGERAAKQLLLAVVGN